MKKISTGSDFFDALWNDAPATRDVHARLWPGTSRALCTGAVTSANELSGEAHSDEDADVTCHACMSVIGAAMGDIAEVVA